jgi:hypothetical protein
MEQVVSPRGARQRSSSEGFPTVDRGGSDHSIANNQFEGYSLESLSNLGQSRHERIVTLLTKVLGDAAKWYDYEIFNEEGFSIDISHESGEKWTMFLESFLRQCVRLAGVNADLHVDGKHLNLVFREYYGGSGDISQTFSVRSSENSRREVAFK